jgi:hypothetical protein
MNRSTLDLCAGCLALGALFARPHAVSAQITVGQNVHVSAARPDRSHEEVLLAADPNNPNRFIACPFARPLEVIRRPRPYLGLVEVYMSEDAGRSWRLAWEMSNADGKGNNDVHCTFGARGEAVFVQALTDPHPPDTSLYGDWAKVYAVARRSTDGGKTWSNEIRLPAGYGLDRQYLASDNTSSKYKGNIYLAGNVEFFNVDGEGYPAMGLWTSRDGGLTWSYPVQMNGEVVGGDMNSWNTVVLEDGTLGFVFTDISKHRRSPTPLPYPIKFITSSDGGQSVGKATLVATSTGHPTPVTVAVDRSNGPFKGRLYVSWDDKRSGRSQMWISHSDDKGQTWSVPIVVSDSRANEDGNGPGVVIPTIAVNKDGIVGAFWYDQRDLPGKNDYLPRFSASFDGSDTWLPSVAVSTHPKKFAESNRSTWSTETEKEQAGSDRLHTVDMTTLDWITGGHTTGFTADANGTFQAVWIDNRTAVHQAWGAPISVKGTVVRNGAAELGTYRDVTPQTEIELVSTNYDAHAQRVTMTLRIRNTSGTTLRGPLKLRILSYDSDVAVVRSANATNGVAGQGAVWDIPASAEVAPGKTSGEIQLVFALSDVRSLKDARDWRTGLVRFKSRVLAK